MEVAATVHVQVAAVRCSVLNAEDQPAMNDVQGPFVACLDSLTLSIQGSASALCRCRGWQGTTSI